MSELIDPRKDDIVLEIGTGSGYQTAILACLVNHIYSIERHEELAASARERLSRLGYNNVTVIHADGYQGLVDYAPYDGIIVTAAPPRTPPALISQVKPGRHLVIPVGVGSQDLLKITPTVAGKSITENITPVRFVPMIHESD
jgi:protein-L-isoaspartate(D-aspartate) O-methyltransferase